MIGEITSLVMRGSALHAEMAREGGAPLQHAAAYRRPGVLPGPFGGTSPPLSGLVMGWSWEETQQEMASQDVASLVVEAGLGFLAGVGVRLLGTTRAIRRAGAWIRERVNRFHRG